MVDGNAAGEPGMDAADGERPCLLVLGMHRSGTSALTRGLMALGASLGDRLLPPDSCNPRGFFEDEDIYAVNFHLMDALGYTWDNPARLAPPRLREEATGGRGQEALRLLRAKTAEGGLAAFKDPRFSRLMPFWRPLLASAGLAPRCVLALRHPDAVAQSLARRDDMEPVLAHALWLRHTLDALDGSRGLPRVLVSYDRLLAAPARELARVGHALGLAVDTAALAEFSRDFLDAGLRHHKPGDAPAGVGEPGPLGRLALRLYAGLEPLAAAPPEALEAGLEKGSLLCLREECARILDEATTL
ncbi:glycosyl transferase family 1 [Desulfovibrio sp.]|uniref:sulfotransferase family protein n=1 Tax=Desulfovibrio sp. TaxID=885 RepID=UPI0023BE742F|nr:glycosyl transferase family 1 [Desulfovibrio sp.]MDE7240476.1 glycosyl transferase family 1 [Desulfovibrio sp.]